jgi:hypothetical protein
VRSIRPIDGIHDRTTFWSQCKSSLPSLLDPGWIAEVQNLIDAGAGLV